MKRLLLAFICLNQLSAIAQSPAGNVYAFFLKQQACWRTLSYEGTRTDTLVTDDTRVFSGSVRLDRKVNDPVTGFRFAAKINGDSITSVYDGRYGYDVRQISGDYTVNPHPDDDLLVNGGGKLIPKDILTLDSSGTSKISVSEMAGTWVIRIRLQDLKKYDVINRYKEIIVSKETFVPLSFRYHQSTFGKIQDLFYELRHVLINQSNAGFSFPTGQGNRSGHPISLVSSIAEQEHWLTGPAPLFCLPTPQGKLVNLAELRGKVVLLDFWEVWCGPCQEAMPAVDSLAGKYKDKGFVAIGINSDLKSRLSAFAFIKSRKTDMIQLMGDAAVSSAYRVLAVPHYVLISREGQIIFSKPGYSARFDAEIDSALRSSDTFP